jgi:hypothetical protein
MSVYCLRDIPCCRWLLLHNLGRSEELTFSSSRVISKRCEDNLRILWIVYSFIISFVNTVIYDLILGVTTEIITHIS